MFDKKKFSFLLLLLLSLLLSSCTKEDKITNTAGIRAVERWKAIINKDWKKAYTYETPAYRRAYSVDDYKGSFGEAIVWKSVKLIKEDIKDNNNSNVTLQLNILFSEGGGQMEIPSRFTEKWLSKDNKWWHIQNK